MSSSSHSVIASVDEDFADLVDAQRLQSIGQVVLEAENQPPAELSILVTDDETVHRLNRQYAAEDKSTDVLAFSLREGEEFVSPDDVHRLGDVIISYPAALWQADEAARPIEDEIAQLLVHGILHLLGYNHAEPAEERTMRDRTQALLAALR